jgi:hypothetical protein
VTAKTVKVTPAQVRAAKLRVRSDRDRGLEPDPRMVKIAEARVVNATAALEATATMTARAEVVRGRPAAMYDERSVEHTLDEASRLADAIVADAQAAAERIRGESERELATSIHRRDTINAQLTNVRKMLATLTGESLPDVTVTEKVGKVDRPAEQDDKTAAEAGAGERERRSS